MIRKWFTENCPGLIVVGVATAILISTEGDPFVRLAVSVVIGLAAGVVGMMAVAFISGIREARSPAPAPTKPTHHTVYVTIWSDDSISHITYGTGRHPDGVASNPTTRTTSRSPVPPSARSSRS